MDSALLEGLLFFRAFVFKLSIPFRQLLSNHLVDEL